MESNIAIREVTVFLPEVLSAVSKLVMQLDAHADQFTESDLQTIIESDATHLYLAYSQENNEIVGMVTLVVYRIPYKKKGWIEDVVVNESHRGKGIGTTLMQHVIAEAKRLQVKTLDLTSRPKREQANHLYQSLGFEKRETNVYRLTL